MKMKMLATALTLSMPLIVGGAYAQTTTDSAGQGANRSSDGGAMNQDQASSPASSTATGGNNAGTTTGSAGSATGATGSGASGAAGTGGATGTTGAGTPGAGAAGTGGTMGTTGAGTTGAGAPGAGAAGAGAAGSPGATAPGMEAQGDAASTEAITGWSAKDDVMGKSVFNENDEKIGDVSDVVISSDGRTMYLLIGAGGFLGMGSKDVAVPFDRFERRDDRILLSGYTKEQLKALPEVRTQR